MAGTTLTLQQPTKRKRDHNQHDDQEVETDTRQQTCLECTLSWPWVIFHRNQDGSRNMDQRKCYTCLGINSQQWELNLIRMNESISKARKKLLRIDPTAPTSTSSVSTPISTTPNEGQGQGQGPSQFTTSQALAMSLNSNHGHNSQRSSNPPINGPISGHNQYQFQPPPPPPPQPQPQPQTQSQTHPDQHMYNPQIIAPQYQDQYGQPLFNPAQAFGYNFNFNNAQPQSQPQGMMYHQPQQQPQPQPRPQQQPHSAVQYQPPPPQPQAQSQPLTQPQSQNIWIQLFRQTEPARAMNWVQMNYHPAAGAPPIPQMELYKHYASTIPRQGFPPILQGREFILGVAKHFEGMGVHLDKGTFTIGGLWRRNQPVATLH